MRKTEGLIGERRSEEREGTGTGKKCVCIETETEVRPDGGETG